MLKDESRGGTSSSQNRMRNLLVIAEIAMSLVLLVGGGLMMQSLRGVLRQSPGFDPDHVLTFVVNLPASDILPGEVWPYGNAAGLRFSHEFLERLRALPGVQGASATNALPASRESQRQSLYHGRTSGRCRARKTSATSRHVDPGYFSVMKIPLIRGRQLSAADTVGRPYVFVVNQAWVKRNSAQRRDPIGKRIRFTNAPEGRIARSSAWWAMSRKTAWLLPFRR